MIPLFRPYMPELPDIDDLLHSGSLAYGAYTKKFEEILKKYFETEYLIATSSFNNAIFVALRTLGLTFGDEVICSPMACLASTQPYLASGMKIHWADVDPSRGTFDPDSVERQLNSNVKAIIHNHFCGYPGYIEEINAIGAKHNIPVIDDGIECFGSKYKGQKIGNCGTDVTIFSLTAARIPNCIDGGIVIFKDKELYKKSLLVRDCGIDRLRFRDALGEISPECDINLIGYSATMSNVNGYIGVKQMEQIDSILMKHQTQALKWHEYFSEQYKYIPIHCEDCMPNYWVYGILADDKRDTIKTFRELGYYASGVHIDNSVYSIFGKRVSSLSGVDEFYSKFVALPCGWWLD